MNRYPLRRFRRHRLRNSPAHRTIRPFNPQSGPRFNRRCLLNLRRPARRARAVVPSDISQGSSLCRSGCVTLIINGDAGGRHSQEVEAHAIGWSVREVAWEAFGARVEGSSRQMELPS